MAGTVTQTTTYNPLATKSINIAAGDLFDTKTLTESKTLNTTWQNTGWAGTSLATGSYLIQVKINDQSSNGLAHYTETYTGIMSWHYDSTNSTDYDEIVLHKAGHASNGNNIYLRTARRSNSTLVLQISCNKTCSAAVSYTLTARRLL